MEAVGNNSWRGACGVCLTPTPLFTGSLGEAEAELAALGWTHRARRGGAGSMHVCPACSRGPARVVVPPRRRYR